MVQDPSGAAIPAAEVRVTQTDTGFSRIVASGSDGSCTIPNLPVGPYRMQATSKGFSSYVQDGIVLRVNSNPVINPTLQVGSITEEIKVTASVAMAETHDNSISQGHRPAADRGLAAQRTPGHTAHPAPRPLGAGPRDGHQHKQELRSAIWAGTRCSGRSS